MANNHSGITMRTDQQASSRRRPIQGPQIPSTTNAGPSTGVTGPTLGIGMNASIGTQAQNRNATTRRRPLSLRHSSVEGELDFGILRQPQNRQPTHMPNTHEAEVRYPDLSNVSNGPGPELPGELQQATPPVPAPVQSGSAAASQQQQEQHPAEVRVATARDLGRRTRPTQRQPHHPRPNNTYLPEPHYIENPPADERGIASYIPNPMPWILAIFNTVGNWICTAFTSVKDVVRWIFHVLWASLMFLTTIVEWIKALWRAFRSLMVILAILACCALCLFVFKSVCSGVNKFCEFEFNPLRPIICPVEMCMKDPYPNLNGTVAAPSAPVVGVFVPEDDRNAKSKDTEYIRSLFRIPHALEGASIMLKKVPYHIGSSSIPQNEKYAYAKTLIDIIQDMNTMKERIEKFNQEYIHAVHIIHKVMLLFEDVLTKIINDYAGSTCPDWGFLRYHHRHTSVAGLQEGINAFVRHCLCMFTNKRDGDGAETVDATLKLQVQIAEFVNSSTPGLQSLNLSAHEILFALSLVQERLTIFPMHVAGALRSVHHNHKEEKDKKDTGRGWFYGWGNFFKEIEEKQNEFSWIDHDTTVLKRCEGDLMGVLGVLDGVEDRISKAEMAIRHLGPRLHELLAKDMHDGWGSASAKIVMRDLTSFTDWTDGGELHLKKLMQEAKEEEDKKWITPMRV